MADEERRYPPAPWHLAGPAVVATGLVDVHRARPFVPADLEIVEVRPGRTAAALVVADYQDQSTFPYGELSVMAAVVRHRGVRGAWISHIWVDSVASLLGGRELWGMDKHLADFRWHANGDNTVSVTADNLRLVTLSWPPPERLWPVPGQVTSIGSVAGDRRRVRGRGVSWLRRVPLSVDIPDDAPFAALGLQDQALRGAAGLLRLRFGGIRILSPPPATPAPAAPAARTT